MNKKIIFLIVPIFLMTFELCFLMPSLAKYFTELSARQDSKSIASWDVSATIPNSTFDMLANQSEVTYTFNVTNDSEVAAIYSIEVNDVPYGVFVKLDNGSYKSRDSNATNIKFDNVGTINANASARTKTHTLTFITSPDAEAIIDKNVTIKVSFKQKNVQ